MSLDLIEKKIENSERLNFDDGLLLFNSPDLLTIGRLANIVRERKNGNHAFFIKNRHINPSNICINSCRFCAYGKKAGDSEAFTLTLEEVIAKAGATGEEFSEFHVVGGLHPDLPFDYYVEIIKTLHSKYPKVHIKAFTAVEIVYFSKISKLSIDEVLTTLKDAGLGSLPGGGAEIFSDRVRKELCPEKASGKDWLNVMERAHNLGIRSTATMLYGHIETNEEKVNHLIALRDLQDKTDGFTAFIPLAFHPKNTELNTISKTGGIEDLKTIAISRLMLDNFSHIKSYWIMVGPKISQISLSFGADDIDGTIVEEKITHAAGADTEQVIQKETLIQLIKETGRIPVERDSLYNFIKIYDEA